MHSITRNGEYHISVYSVYSVYSFDVLLTVHYSNAQFLFQLMHHNFTLLTKSLYMFRAPTCPSSGGQTIHTPQLVQLHLL